MKPYRGISDNKLRLFKTLLFLLLLIASPVLPAQNTNETPNIIIRDTFSPLLNESDLQNSTHWKTIPSNLLMLEDNPPAAMSDPAFSGRRYVFEGDTVVENEKLTAVFLSKKGKARIYWKTDADKKMVEIIPLQLKGMPSNITDCRILQNTGDEVALEVSFSAPNIKEPLSVVFSFAGDEIVDIAPAENVRGISISAPIEYFVVPDFIADDLVYDPAQYPSAETLSIIPSNLFLGLLQDRNSIMVITTPDKNNRTTLIPDNNKGLIDSVDIDSHGDSIHLALLQASGIWHKEPLKPSFLEKDVKIEWKKPFPAKWITQFTEGGVNTTFTFRDFKNTIWRGAVGSYNYPVWFDGGDTFYRMGKKIQPRGDSVIYFLERKNTPLPVSSPVEIMKQTLGRQTASDILDLKGRTLRTHHRRGAEGIRRACTCGCTAAIEEVFKAGREFQQKDYVVGAVDDMRYFVEMHVARINQYQAFADNMIELLNRTKKSNPQIKPFLESMEQVVSQIPDECTNQAENMKTPAFADQLARQTKALAQKSDPKNLQACLDLCKQWRSMGGAQDDVLANCHRTTRHLYQQAGYACAAQPDALETARQIRLLCRDCLKNPDGYEIWPDY